jgi:hypothetical protein
MKIIGGLLFLLVMWAGIALGGFAGFVVALLLWIWLGAMIQIRN